MTTPVRFGPEWWACYAAAFAIIFERSAAYGSAARAFEGAARLAHSHAERAAAVADLAIKGFAEARAGGGIT